MKRLVSALIFIALSNCSLLFDPSRVGDAGSDAGPCAGEGPLAAPAYLESVTGHAPNSVTWKWPAVEGASGYTFCSTEGCAVADATCTDSTCSLERTNLTEGQRVAATVASNDGCGVPGASVGGSAVPLSVANVTLWQTEQRNCGAVMIAAAGDELTVVQNGVFCETSFTLADDAFADVRIEAELLNAGMKRNLNAGITIRQKRSGYRLRAVSGPTDAFKADTAMLLQRDGAGDEAFMADSTYEAPVDGSRAVRIETHGPTVTWWEGSSTATLQQLVRWTDRETRTGSLGFGGRGDGTFRIRALRVTSRTTLQVDADAGYTLPLNGFATIPGVRSSTTTSISCPEALEDCDGGRCKPVSGSACAYLPGARANVNFGATLGIPAPAGMDPARDWELALRFAVIPEDGGLNVPVLGIRDTTLINSGMNGMSVLEMPTGAQLAYGVWHDVRLTFPADGGFISADLDGRFFATSTPWPLPNRGRSFDFIRMGNIFSSATVVASQLEVHQK